MEKRSNICCDMCLLWSLSAMLSLLSLRREFFPELPPKIRLFSTGKRQQTSPQTLKCTKAPFINLRTTCFHLVGNCLVVHGHFGPQPDDFFCRTAKFLRQGLKADNFSFQQHREQIPAGLIFEAKTKDIALFSR